MSHASGALTTLAFDQEAHQTESALDIFLQVFPTSAALFETAQAFPRAEVGIPRDPVTCVIRGGTWDAVRRRCNPGDLPTLPMPTFPGSGPMTPEEDAKAFACAQRGGFYDRASGACQEETGTPRPGTGPSACLERCKEGNALQRGACQAACGFGATIAPILIVVIGIILLLVAFALIAK